MLTPVRGDADLNKDEINRKEHLLLCPVCKGKTRTKVNPDTILIKFPLFCPKCKRETLVNVEHQEITVIKEPAA